MDEDSRLQAMMDLAKMAEEELDPELQPYVHDTGASGWTVLQHPLVYQVPHVNNGLANLTLRAKKRELERAVHGQGWHTYVWLHERPHRFDAMMRVFNNYGIDELKRLDLIRSVWIDSENIWQHYDEWRELLSETDTQWLMFDNERERLRSLPDVVPIYRGALAEVNEDGLSYTLDQDRARWFARRFGNAHEGEEPIVIHAEVPRDKILALFETRNEDEVIVLPESLKIIAYQEA